MPLKHRRILDLNKESFGILDVVSLFQGDFPGRSYTSFDHHVLETNIHITKKIDWKLS